MIVGGGTRSPDERRWRRPGRKWCTETAIRLLKIASRDHDAGVTDGETFKPLLDNGDAELLVKAAAVLDRYGQRLERL